jgi:hypothetical protein
MFNTSNERFSSFLGYNIFFTTMDFRLISEEKSPKKESHYSVLPYVHTKSHQQNVASKTMKQNWRPR